MKYTTFLTVCIILICLCTSAWAQAAPSNSTTTGNCIPSNCQAICNPGCNTDTTCALGTMKSCGVCPSSSCVDNALLGLPKSGNSGGNDPGSSSSSSGGTDGGMIGGIVGGLVGAGLLLAAALFILFRHKKQKKGGLPFIVSRSRLDTPSSLAMSSPTTTPTPTGNRFVGNNTLSSPSPYSLASLSSYQRQQHHLDQRTMSGGHQQQPRPISTATNDMNDDDDDDRSSLSSISQRGSAMIANVTQLQQHQQQQASQSAQAFQVTRVKPQIMRVNTVRVMDQQPDTPSSSGNLSRSGSVRTVLTRDNSIRSLSRSNTAPSRPPATQLPSQEQQQQQQHRSTVYSTSSTLSPESSPTTATAIATAFTPAKRTSTPLLSVTNTTIATAAAAGDPFDDRHSVIEDDLSTTDDSLPKTTSPPLPLDDALSSTTSTK